MHVAPNDSFRVGSSGPLVLKSVGAQLRAGQNLVGLRVRMAATNITEQPNSYKLFIQPSLSIITKFKVIFNYSFVVYVCNRTLIHQNNVFDQTKNHHVYTTHSRGAGGSEGLLEGALYRSYCRGNDA